MMTPVNCNLCGIDDYTVVFPKGYAQIHRIVRCNKCGLMYANPQEQVDCDSFLAQRDSSPYDPESEQNRQYFQKQVAQLPDNERALHVLSGLLPKRGKVLEVGSFLGIFLNRIRADGWEVTGLEPYRPAANYARTRYGLRILEGILPVPALPDGEFDAVVMLHVIEHMPDPAASLREIHRLLKPGGVLIVETPRFDSLTFKLLGRRERSIQNCAGHIFFFTAPTLRRILERNGFDVFRTEFVGRTLTLDRLLYNVGLIARSALVQRSLGFVSRRLRLDSTRVYLNLRDMQRVYARAN